VVEFSFALDGSGFFLRASGRRLRRSPPRLLSVIGWKALTEPFTSLRVILRPICCDSNDPLAGKARAPSTQSSPTVAAGRPIAIASPSCPATTIAATSVGLPIDTDEVIMKKVTTLGAKW